MRFAEPASTVHPIPWARFRAELLSVYSPPHVAKATRSKMVKVLNDVQALGITSTAEFTTELVARFCAARPPGQSDWTLQSYLMCLRSATNYAAASGYCRISPFTVRRLSRWVKPEPPADKRHLSKQELRALLDLLARDVEQTEGWRQWRARRLQAAVAILAYCGLRKSECLRLHLSDIDLERSVIWLSGHGRKLKTSGSNKPVPIPNALVPILTSWIAHRMDAPFGYPMPDTCDWLIPTCNRKSPWVSGHQHGKALYRLKIAAKRVGIEDINFQMLRRSWATHAESWGFGEALIQRVLRHSSPMTSRKFYRQADCVNLAAATADIDF
jgi:integrase